MRSRRGDDFGIGQLVDRLNSNASHSVVDRESAQSPRPEPLPARHLLPAPAHSATPKAQAILVEADQVADALGLDDEEVGPPPPLLQLSAMTLIPCPECQKPISADAIACPQCGRPLKVFYWPYGYLDEQDVKARRLRAASVARKTIAILLVAAIGLFAAAMCLVFFGPRHIRSSPPERAPAVSPPIAVPPLNRFFPDTRAKRTPTQSGPARQPQQPLQYNEGFGTT
jgi:hypothetical protein